MSSSSEPVTFLPLGAIIQSFTIGGHSIALGFPSAELYKSHNAPFFGETIGRYANRIASGKIDSLNGQSYQLAKNEKGVSHLHGGDVGWGKKEWEGPKPTSRNGREEVMFKYVSEDGEENYPGKVECRVYYWVGQKKGGESGSKGKEEVTLEWEYEIELIGSDAESTAINVTNHGYWNISPGPNIAGTIATFSTNQHLPVDDSAIPTGAITSFPGITANEPVHLTADAPFIDHCFIIDSNGSSIPIDTRSLPLKEAVRLEHPETGVHLVCETTEPAFQFYTGEGIHVAAIEEAGVPSRGKRAGIALEPSRYVNAVNVEEWKGQVVLKKGEVWGSKTRFTAWVE